MMEYLKALNEKKGTTILLITHDMDIVRRYAKRTLVLCDGRVVFTGTPAELFATGEALKAWGLRRPVVSTLSLEFGLTGVTGCEAFCDALAGALPDGAALDGTGFPASKGGAAQ